MWLAFLPKKNYLLFREKGKEEEGEEHQCARDTLIGCLQRAPYWGPGTQSRRVP